MTFEHNRILNVVFLVLMSIPMENLWTFWLDIELNIKRNQNINEVKYLNVPFY